VSESVPPELKLPLRRWALLALKTLVIGYAVVMFCFTLFQRKLIYVPTRLTLDAAEREAAGDGFVPWHNKSGQLIGWESPAKSPSKGSVLIVHGNAGWALNRAYMAAPIHEAAPLDVYILEYPGFGAREGTPDEDSLLAASDEAFESLPDNLPVYVVSESLGTGVAAHLAQKYPLDISGLALFVPYDRLASVAQNHVPFLPAYYLLWDRFEPAEWLQDYGGPVEVIVAGADEIIPPALGRRLYEEYGGPKQLQVLDGAHHNETTDESPGWWKDVFAFWHQHPLPPKPGSKRLAPVTPE
jgi:pimeloyl-ACP methyl ester carboxylesterase